MGGIHTYDGKELSKDKPITVLLPKGELVFPMSQHIGAPAKPVVAKGDKVLVGQIIGEAGGFISSNIISSVSGTVKAIEKRLTVSGEMKDSIIVENDNEYKSVEGFGKERDYKKLTKDEIRAIVKEAGIVGLGGAGFPTHVKLTPKEDSKIDHVLVNAAECEPYLTSDYRLMMEEPEKLIGGLRIILSLFANAKGVITIEDNKPEAAQKLKALIQPQDKIEVQVVQTKYPQGAERQLINVVTGREFNYKKLPSDVGCIVDNVDTVISIYNAVALSTPLIRKILTITGDAVVNPGNFNVRTGTNYEEVIDAAGGFKQKPEKILSGGPMMGQALFSIQLPVMKTSSSIVAFLKDQAAVQEEPCIRCGRCIAACPNNLAAQKLAACAARSDEENFIKLHGLDCCACGCCTFVCPAKRSLTVNIMQTKQSILSRKKA
jgi:electron transport complex protein RnfC